MAYAPDAISPDSEPAPCSGQRMALDPARFNGLVTGQLDFVWRCLRRFGVPAADADDAAQQVFLVVYEKLAAVPLDKERAFLVATTARVAANARRSIRRRQSAYEDLALVPDDRVRCRSSSRINSAPERCSTR